MLYAWPPLCLPVFMLTVEYLFKGMSTKYSVRASKQYTDDFKSSEYSPLNCRMKHINDTVNLIDGPIAPCTRQPTCFHNKAYPKVCQNRGRPLL